MAAVVTASRPDWPVSAQDLAREDGTRDPQLFSLRLVAEVEGRVVAVGHLGHDDQSFESWRYRGGLNVHPDVRGRGIGRALYAAMLDVVRGRGGREVRTMLSDRPHHVAGRAFLERRGFAVTWERFESQLDTEDLDLGGFGGLLSAVAADGVQLRSLAELAGDADHARRLWELDSVLFEDVPLGTPFTRRPFERWVADELEDPNLRPALSFVAVRPGVNDPLTGDYVGYSTLGSNEPGMYFIGMTGVVRAERGKGIARALKVAAMRALQGVGGGVIKTFNDPPNRAMLGMNEALGFRRTATMFRYELRLDGGQG